MVAGVRQTLGSAAFTDNVPDTDDHVTAALRAAGAVLTGKTATPEFGLPCYTETAVGPPARTPWDLGRSAGGSSGGAAAAVAAGLAPAAQGSDGGGSIRIPSSVCGLFGLKPSRGRISGAPLMPDLFGLGTDGPIARIGRRRGAAARRDDREPAGRHVHPAAAAAAARHSAGYASRPPGRLRIGRTLQHPVGDGAVHADCVTAYEDASRLLDSLGHDVEDIQMPFGPDAVPAFETLWYAMATLAPVDPAREDRLLPLTRYLRGRGQQVRAGDLVLAQAYLQLVVRGALAVLNGYDAILTPTLASPPVPVGYFEEVAPAGELRAAEAVHPVHGVVQRLRPAGRERPAVLERRRPAHRRHAGRADGRGGHAHLAVRPAGGGLPVAGPAPGPVVTPRWA